MSANIPSALPAPPPATVKSLEMLLDYAIVEGAELRLPVFVLLLRMARLELVNGAGQEAPGLQPQALLKSQTHATQRD